MEKIFMETIKNPPPSSTPPSKQKKKVKLSEENIYELVKNLWKESLENRKNKKENPVKI